MRGLAFRADRGVMPLGRRDRRSQRPHQVGHALDPFVRDGLIEFFDESSRETGSVEVRRADLYGARSGDDELHHVVEALDASHADDRDLHRLRDLPHDTERDRLDRWSRKAADAVAQNRPSLSPIDGHALDRVDQRDGVGTACSGGGGDLGHVGDVRRQLRDDGQLATVTDGTHDRLRFSPDRFRNRRRRSRSGTRRSAPAPRVRRTHRAGGPSRRTRLRLCRRC